MSQRSNRSSNALPGGKADTFITNNTEGSDIERGLNVIEEYEEQLIGPDEQDVTETERLREQGRKLRKTEEEAA